MRSGWKWNSTPCVLYLVDGLAPEEALVDGLTMPSLLLSTAGAIATRCLRLAIALFHCPGPGRAEHRAEEPRADAMGDESGSLSVYAAAVSYAGVVRAQVSCEAVTISSSSALTFYEQEKWSLCIVPITFRNDWY